MKCCSYKLLPLLALTVGAVVLNFGLRGSSSEPNSNNPSTREARSMTSVNVTATNWENFDKPSDAQLRENLSSLQYKVTQHEGTERAFTGEYWDNKREGLYVDVVSGEPLFSSKDKFESGTGWPSFVRPVDGRNVVEKSDRGFFMTRVEVRSKHGDSHLGHVFEDGPKPTGLRYCINSASLRFVPAEDLEKEGYGDYVSLFTDSTDTKTSNNQENEDTMNTKTEEVAVLAGGCFWGMEDLFRREPGVLETRVGYTGGDVRNATYHNHGTHAEAIEVTYDPTKTTYRKLLEFFFKVHDPTTLNRQGNDRGMSYRSAIYYTTDEQKEVARKTIEDVNESGIWPGEVVTTVEPASDFWQAEPEHQDYLLRNPNGYTCHFPREDWVLPGSDE